MFYMRIFVLNVEKIVNNKIACVFVKSNKKSVIFAQNYCVEM